MNLLCEPTKLDVGRSMERVRRRRNKKSLALLIVGDVKLFVYKSRMRMRMTNFVDEAENEKAPKKIHLNLISWKRVTDVRKSHLRFLSQEIQKKANEASKLKPIPCTKWILI